MGNTCCENCSSFKCGCCCLNIVATILFCNCCICKCCDACCACGKRIVVPQTPDSDTVRLVVGSCYSTQAQPAPTQAWKKITQLMPNMTILSGDNVYVNWYWCCPSCCGVSCLCCNMAGPREDEIPSEADPQYYIDEYTKLLDQSDLAASSQDMVKIPVVDNHDGRERLHAGGQASKDGFMFLMRQLDNGNHLTTQRAEITSSPEHGRYYYYDFNKNTSSGMLQIRVVALDVFWEQDNAEKPLGAQQWAWLEDVIDTTPPNAFLVLVSATLVGGPKIDNCCGSSIPYRKWLDHQEDRLHALLAGRMNKTVVLSGDIHASSVYERDGLYELTASSLSQSIMNYQLYGWRCALCWNRCLGNSRQNVVSKLDNQYGFGVLDIKPTGWTWAFVNNDTTNLHSFGQHSQNVDILI